MLENHVSNDVIITSSQAADLLGISEGTLRKWRWQSRGPRSIHYGSRCVRYRREDVLAWREGCIR